MFWELFNICRCFCKSKIYQKWLDFCNGSRARYSAAPADVDLNIGIRFFFLLGIALDCQFFITL